MDFIAQPEQPCLQGPGEGELAIYEELTALEESSDASAGCLVGERPVAPVATPVLWGKASGSDALSYELGFGFGDGAVSQASLEAGSPFPCMASILEKQIMEAEQLFPANEEPEPLGSGMHVSRSCTDLKAALAAPAAFGAALCPATPVPADVLAVKPRPAEPGVSASSLEGAAVEDGRRAGLPGLTHGAATVRLGLAFNGAAAVRDRCGPLLSAASWRGCTRSAWCHRDNRHRGSCSVLTAVPGLSAAALSDAPAPPAAAAFVTICGEGETKGLARLGSPQPLRPDSEQGSAADTGSPLAAHVAATAAPAECESGNDEVEGGSSPKGPPARALHSASLDSQQSSGSGSASVQRRSSSAAWVSARDPEATDLSGLSAKSGASADSDDDDGAARSPLRPLPTRMLPPLSVLQAADGPLGMRTAEPGKGMKRKGRPKGRDGAKAAKRPAAPARSIGVVAPGQQCTQCGTQVTPVWRAGPSGPKTLCNACGVRYMKSAKKR